MIRELFHYFINKSGPEAKAFGHLYESIALIEREKRCHSYWLSHRTNSKNTIIKVSEQIKNHNRLLILGSGPLHEIPIEELSKTFNRIDLIDVVHLKAVKEQYQHLKNIFFIEADITELESKILKEKKIINQVPKLFQDIEYDLVISANLMSQLSYHLRNFLEKRAKPKLSDSELDQFAYEVSRHHYLYLQNFSCPVLLITDTETQLTGINDEVIETQLPYIDFELPHSLKNWWWNVAPRPEYSKDYSVRMKVSVFVLNFRDNPTLINL